MPVLAMSNQAFSSDAQAKKLLPWMERKALEYARTPECQEHTAQILKGVDHRNVRKVAVALDTWFRKHIQYSSNPATGQVLVTPKYVFSKFEGPCVAATAVAAIALAAGQLVRLVLWGRKHYSHVFIEIYSAKDDRWYIVDWVAPRSMLDELTTGYRFERRIKPDRKANDDDSRVYVKCACGEQVEKIAGVEGVAAADLSDLSSLPPGANATFKDAAEKSFWDAYLDKIGYALKDITRQMAHYTVIGVREGMKAAAQGVADGAGLSGPQWPTALAIGGAVVAGIVLDRAIFSRRN